LNNDEGLDHNHTLVNMGKKTLSFSSSLAHGILRDLIVMAIVFCVTTSVSAAVCVYHELPVALLLPGGFVSLGVVLLFKTDSTFE